MTCHECPVCMEMVAEEKMVMCQNGHRVCEKHQLERIRAIYQEGRPAFNGGGQGQHCFMCRCNMKDDLFSDQYFKLLRLIQSIELPKLTVGQDWFNTKPEYREISLRVVNEVNHLNGDSECVQKVGEIYQEAVNG